MAGVQILTWATAVLLLSIRVSILFIATPVFGGVPIPAMVRAVLILALATGLAGGVSVSISLNDSLALLEMALHEALAGGVIVVGLYAGFAVFQFAGRLLDIQIGFGFASLVDIASRASVPLLGSLLSMLAVIVFFSVDGHHVMLKVLQLSMEKLPPGSSLVSIDFGALIAQFGASFSFGFIIVAPVVLCLLIIDFGMALMSRTMPQMNVFVMALGLKVIVGLVVFATVVPLAGNTMRRVFESIFSNWVRVFG